MPSSTSSSEPHELTRDEARLDSAHREVPEQRWSMVVVVALFATLLGVAGWESYWRANWHTPHAQNTDDLWAETRRRVAQEERELVIIGSSRILFDVDIHVLREELGGELPIQLALEGTSPRPFLDDLAADPDFDGFLIVGATPGIYFEPGKPGGPRMAALGRAEKQTPAQRMGQEISIRLERFIAFMDPDTRLFTQLERLPWPQTRGMKPALQMPRKLLDMHEDRNGEMWPRLDEDPAYAEHAQNVWAGFWKMPSEPPTDEDAAKTIESTRVAVEKIRARGGEVIFVRCPSAGGYAPREAERTPRERFWDRLLREVPAFGIHFADHPGLQGHTLPEWSHISARDQDAFTRALGKLIAPEYRRWRGE